MVSFLFVALDLTFIAAAEKYKTLYEACTSIEDNKIMIFSTMVFTFNSDKIPPKA